MDENELATEIIRLSIAIHKELGPGLLESVYETVLASELERGGNKVQRQAGIPIIYNGQNIEEAFRADLIVENKIIIELKSVEKVTNVHKKQLLTYLRLSGLQLGLLINFGEELLKNGLTRIVNGLS